VLLPGLVDTEYHATVGRDPSKMPPMMKPADLVAASLAALDTGEITCIPALDDIREPKLAIACERCGRHGRYSVARLIAVHGADAKLTDLPVTRANARRPVPSASTTNAKRSSRALLSELNPSEVMNC
jgi:hypothetical protein